MYSEPAKPVQTAVQDPLTGWLLDVYAAPPDEEAETPAGVIAWVLGDDGQRHRLALPFPISFYAAGTPAQLRDLWRFLRKSPIPVKLARQERHELFSPDPLTVLAVEAASPAAMSNLFNQAVKAFPDLTYFDGDIAIPLHGAARWDLFPLARCRLTQENSLVSSDTPWDLDPPAPPLRVLSIEPDCDPDHAPPRELRIKVGVDTGIRGFSGSTGCTYRLSLEPLRPLLINLAAILNRHDPDLLLTSWGDSWLLPMLLERSQELGLPLPLNRDPRCEVIHRPEHSYFSYGQVIYRDRQVHLFGRWHIDRQNAMLWDDYTLEGVLETARVTSLPVQTAARVSPGTGISSMQIVTALRLGVLVPWRKAEPERFKRAADLFAADQGGMVYQPLIGLHGVVGAIDFVSMYPGIMVRFNISPETAGAGPPKASELVPFPGYKIKNQLPIPGTEAQAEKPDFEQSFYAKGVQNPGLVPRTLAPLLNKRIYLKNNLAAMPNWDPRRGAYKARASAQKWLLVTCFGYLGYRNARFGRIEAHEAVTAYGREALLRAKEAAEDLGFTVLHMYVDGLWVKRDGAKSVDDFQALLEAISKRTGLPISLDGIYRWVVFLSSRLDRRVPVPNRYFGVFQDGSLKVRGLEARRHDTPKFIADTQMEMLQILATAPDAEQLPAYLPKTVARLRRRLNELQQCRVPLESLLACQKISRELELYRSPSPAARAAAQLQEIGKEIRPGQRVRFLYLRGKPDVHAWGLPETPDPRRLDIDVYTKLMMRAAENILIPLGGEELLYPVMQPPLFVRKPLRKEPRSPILQTQGFAGQS